MSNQVCVQCGSGPLTGRQRKFCSRRCGSRYHSGYRGAREVSQADRFWSKLEAVDDCWIWTGCKDSDGYGQARWDGATVSAHRKSYELMVGPIPGGLVIDHLCRNRACVNPYHLDPVPDRVNIRRGRTGARNRAKTHCLQGHPFNEENTYRNGNRRSCRACKRLGAARAYAAQKGRGLNHD